MEFPTTDLFVLHTTLLLLCSSCSGYQGSANNDLKTLVLHPFHTQSNNPPNLLINILSSSIGSRCRSLLAQTLYTTYCHQRLMVQKLSYLEGGSFGLNPLHQNIPLQKKFDDPANHQILREVPSGSNPLHHNIPRQKKFDDPTNHQILREVPLGSNPLHHNVPPQKKFDDPANHQILREVPSGSNPLHHNVPPQKKLDDPANFYPTRLVPTGPNRAESPKEPPSKVLSAPLPSPSPAKAKPWRNAPFI